MTIGVASWVYVVLFARGIRRSRLNIMRGSVLRSLLDLERHSWRWWVWTLACRPSFEISRRGPYLYVGVPFLHLPRMTVPLPSGLFPTHMRGLRPPMVQPWH